MSREAVINPVKPDEAPDLAQPPNVHTINASRMAGLRLLQAVTTESHRFSGASVADTAAVHSSRHPDEAERHRKVERTIAELGARYGRENG